MNAPTSNCQPNKLSDLLVGTLSDLESDAMLSHLESCPHCQVRLEQLAAQDSQWKHACEILASSNPAPPNATAETREFQCLPEKGAQWTESLSKKLLASPSHPEMLGRLGRYDIERFVGAGGMGIVFKGFDTELNRPVAIKVLSPSLAFNGTARQRFAREARAAAAVVHEHVVPIHNVESNGELPFLVMHFAQGESLQAKLDREGPLELKQILRIGKQIAAGLAAAHAQGLVHRDIKPANVIIEEEIDRALLTDFGLAQTADDASLTCSGYLPGTPQYMSPEQARGEKVSGLSDLFSTGSVLYAMSTGRPPFRAETSLAVLRKINDSEPKNIRELNPDMPHWFCRIVQRLMAKRPEDRYGSAKELADLLEKCLAHVQQPLLMPLPTSLLVPSRLALAGAKMRRYPWRLTLGALCLVALLFMLWPRTGDLEPKAAKNASSINSLIIQSEGPESVSALPAVPVQTEEPAKTIVWRGAPLRRSPQDALRAKLETRLEAQWNEIPLATVLQELLGSVEVDFDIRSDSLAAELSQEPITLSMTASRKSLLHQILRSKNLSYIVHEGSIEIVDAEYAAEYPTLHRYDLSHITTNSQEAHEIQQLIEWVIEPEQWSTVSPSGYCSLGLVGPILHVRATESMHAQIAQLLASLEK